MNANDSPEDPAGQEQLAAIARWLRWLTVGMFAVALALLFLVAAVEGAIIDFHAGESILIAGTTLGGGAAGFVFGWLARRAIG